MTQTIAHVDMDSYYASVEVSRNPALQGKPVIVGADPSARGVVLTCSYEARSLGIHSAMPIGQAFRLCPEGVFLPPNFPLYAATSKRIMTILSRFSSDFRQAGIDEAYLDVSEHAYGIFSKKRLARLMQKSIREEVGLSCSVGMAPTRTIAKIASAYIKPNGATIVEEREVGRFLAPLPVERIPGVGKKTREALNALGIATIGELARFPEEDLVRHFGTYASRLKEMARGTEPAHSFREETRTQGREHTFAEDVSEKSVVASCLRSLSERLFEDLCGRSYRTVVLKVRFSDFETIQKSRTFPLHVSGTHILQRTAHKLLERLWQDVRKVRLVGVRVSDVRPHDARQAMLPS